ncbi:unnamed protein product [Rotaria sp. Silwood1]|nr:unnamed protein product [Rotaria sp. Silwood1]
MKEATNDKLKGILNYTDDEVASTDFISDTYSSIFNAKDGVTMNMVIQIVLLILSNILRTRIIETKLE